jgi:hypothetical protein
MWIGWLLQRAQTALAAGDFWPAEWKQTRLGQQQMITYLTPAESDQLIDDLRELAGRYLANSCTAQAAGHDRLLPAVAGRDRCNDGRCVHALANRAAPGPGLA